MVIFSKIGTCFHYKYDHLLSNYHSSQLKFIFHSISTFLSWLIFFFQSPYFIPKMFRDDSDDDLEIITGGMEEGSTSHRNGTHYRRSIRRDRLQGCERLMLDYFAASPVYLDRLFRRRFRMRRPLFFVLYLRLKITNNSLSKEEMQLEHLILLLVKRLPLQSGC
jgi:hypothetical protein